MIKSTFIFIPGVGKKTEERFWEKGILTWDDLKKCVNGLTRIKRKIVCDYLERANIALSRCDASFFAKHLPQREYWRVYNEFRTKTLYLDIETTGLSLYYDRITLIGTFDGHKYRIFLRDVNLPEFKDYLRNYEVIVTFNGKLFDIPFIRKEFPRLKLPPLHIDLKYILRGFGITGSLKEVEEKLGIQRPKYVREVNGRGAAVLWNKFIRGDDEALRKLIMYNIQDTVNLQTIMHICYQKKIEEIESKMDSSPQQKLINAENRKINYYLPPLNFNIPDVVIRRLKDGLLEVHSNNEVIIRINRSKIKKTNIKIEELLQKIRNNGYTPISVGIDLSASEKRKSGICILKDKVAYLDVVRTDEEIVSKVMEAEPTVISIDSPLSLPKGRCCADDSCECRKYGITRECERILKKRGINVYPCLIKSMQKLTMRGIKLAKLLERQGYEVIESYPGAAQDILGLPRKRIDLRELEVDLVNMGIEPVSSRKTVTHDEIDALTSALVGYFYLAGSYEAVGNIDEGYLIIPELKK